MPKTITLNNRCKLGATNKALVYTTRCTKSRIFNIPFNQILSKNDSEIQVNENHIEKAMEFEITDWIYGLLKNYLDRMDKRNLRL